MFSTSFSANDVPLFAITSKKNKVNQRRCAFTVTRRTTHFEVIIPIEYDFIATPVRECYDPLGSACQSAAAPAPSEREHQVASQGDSWRASRPSLHCGQEHRSLCK